MCLTLVPGLLLIWDFSFVQTVTLETKKHHFHGGKDQKRYLHMLRYWTGKDFFFSIIIILGRVGIVNEAERWHNTTPRKQLWPVVLLLSPILCQLSLGPLVSYMVPKCFQEHPALSWAPSCTDKCCWVRWIRMGPSRGHTQGIFLAH